MTGFWGKIRVQFRVILRVGDAKNANCIICIIICIKGFLRYCDGLIDGSAMVECCVVVA